MGKVGQVVGVVFVVVVVVVLLVVVVALAVIFTGQLSKASWLEWWVS